jgi:Domain of unknown function (DUF4397)
MCSSKWRAFCGIITMSASLVAIGCGNSTATYVRSVNASNGLTKYNYTIQVGLQGVASSIPYGTEGVQPKGDNYSVNDSSGNYRPIAAGNNQMLKVTGSNNMTLFSGTQSFLANTYYTIVTLAQAPSIEVRTLTDGDVAPSGGDFKLRFMQVAPIAGTVDIYVTAQGASISGATPVLSNFQFSQVSQGYLSETAGPIEVQITAAGNPSKVLYTGIFTGAGGDLYTAYFLDPPTGGPSTTNSLLLVQDPALTSTSSKM